MRAVLAAGTLLGRAFYLFDRGHRRLAIENLRAAFPLRTEAECRAIAREMFAHFGRLLMVLLKFSTMHAGADARVRRVRRRGARRARARAGARRAALHRALRVLGDQRARARARRSSRWRCSRGRSTTRCCTICSSRCGRATGNSVIYRRGAHPPRAARARREPGGRGPDRSAHADGRRRLRGLLQPSGGDDVGAGGAGAADRRAGRPGVRAAAAGRTLPHGLRARRSSRRPPTTSRRSASSRSAAPTCSRCTCAAIRSCGCGCTAAGATCPAARRVGGMFPAAAARRSAGPATLDRAAEWR